jgi:hypothetical protein
MVPDHLIPHELLLWGRDGEETCKPVRISLLVGPSRTTLHGLRVKYIGRSPQPKRQAGMRTNVLSNDKPHWAGHEVILEIDGSAGERIDEIAVGETADDALAFKASVSGYINYLLPCNHLLTEGCVLDQNQQKP